MRFDWKAWLGLAVTVLLLWIAFRGVDLGLVWEHLRGANWALLALAVAVTTAGFAVRAIRWRFLLDPLAPRIGFRSRFAATSIGFMANNLLPARAGEFARAYSLARIEPVTMSGAFGSLVVERFLDLLTLLTLLFVALQWPTFPAEGGSQVGPFLQGATWTLVVLVVILIALLVRPRLVVRWVERVARRLPRSLARPIVDALESFIQGLGVLKSPGLLAGALAWSLGFWLWNSLSFWIGFYAFGIELDFVAAIFVQGIVAFGVALPSVPGFFGPFHLAARIGLETVYGVAVGPTLAFAVGYHLGGFVPVTAIGLWYAWRIGLSMREVESSEERVESAVEVELDRGGERDP